MKTLLKWNKWKKQIYCKFLFFLLVTKSLEINLLYIQLPYGYVKNNKQIQFNLPKGYEEEQYIKDVPYITNQDPAAKNCLLNLIRNREDLKKWLLATGPFGNEIQDDLNAIVGFDENFNNAIVRHSLDLKDQAIFRNPNPINVTFHDMKKFDLVNPVIGKLATQVKASKLTDYQLTKKLLQQDEVDELQLRLDKSKYGIEKDDDEKGGEEEEMAVHLVHFHLKLRNKK